MQNTRIAILAHPCRTGGGLVGTQNFLRSLKNVAKDEIFLIVFSAGDGYELIELPPQSEVFVYQGSHTFFDRLRFEIFTLPKIVAKFRPDVIIGMGNTGLINPQVPQTIFIRQAKVFYEKKYHPHETFRNRLRLIFLKWQIAKSLPKTNIVFCQTPVVAKRFSKKFDYPVEQTRILKFPAPSELQISENHEKLVVTEGRLDSFRVLMLTNYGDHRNPHILIPLCRRFGTKLIKNKTKFITTIETDDHPKAKRFLKDIKKYNLTGIIDNVGRLSRKEVSEYYGKCHLLWLPTMLETLGVPYLEAMKAGVAIMAPDLDFAHYVCGDTAVYYNPLDIEDMFNKLMFIRDNETVRRNLIEKGRKELTNENKFSKNWDSLAAYVLCELKSLVKC